MRPTVVARAVSLSFAVIAAMPIASAVAQHPTEAGLVRDAKTSTPLECLHVVLLDSAGDAVAHTVTAPDGAFMLEAPGAGRFRVRFQIYGWEWLVGPVDTLANGDNRERAYPLDFSKEIEPEDASPEAVRARALFLKSLESGSAWKSAVAPQGAPIFEHAMMRQLPSGSVLSQFVLDSAGQVLGGVHTISATDGYLDKLFREAFTRWRWQPATLDGHPMCELVRKHVTVERQPTRSMIDININ